MGERQVTTSFPSNVMVNLGSFVVDIEPSPEFDIYDHFGVNFREELVEDWIPSTPLPFQCRAECSIFSGEHKITCPITATSHQLYSAPPFDLSRFSPLVGLVRDEYMFTWDEEIEIPISYAELPSDSRLVIQFYACLFRTKSKFIGETSIPLFTAKKQRLRTGPYILTFPPQPSNNIERHVRRVTKGKLPSYQFVDDRLALAIEHLHPNDIELFFNSLLNPMEKPVLSKKSQFIKLSLKNPAGGGVAVYYNDLVINRPDRFNTLNPCQQMYKELIRAHGQSKTLVWDKNKFLNELKKITKLPPLTPLHEFQQNFLVSNAEQCFELARTRHDFRSLPFLFRSVKWSESPKVVEMLNNAPTVSISMSLEFLTSRYNVEPVRQFAIRSLQTKSAEQLQLYIPQLLQGLKQPFTEGLKEILLDRASKSIIFASGLYWNCQLEKQFPLFIEILDYILNELPDPTKEEIRNEVHLIERIESLLLNAREGKTDPKVIRSTVRSLLESEYSDLNNFAQPIRLPLDPKVIVTGIDTSNIIVPQSKMKPVVLMFRRDNNEYYRIVFKFGDDMRQDALVLQLFEIMDGIFRKGKFEMGITAYKAMAFSDLFGCCQFVEKTTSLFDVEAKYTTGGNPILSFLRAHGSDTNPRIIENFRNSLAAYSLMTYVLKIGDRHNNNILLTEDGRILHIDYGYILGDTTKPFTPPIKLTKDMVGACHPDVDNEKALDDLTNLASPAFNLLQQKPGKILFPIELMFCAGMACFKENPERRLKMVESTLLLNSNPAEAHNILKGHFLEAVNSKFQGIWDSVHSVAIALNPKGAE